MSALCKVLWVIGLFVLLSLFADVTGVTGNISNSIIEIHFWVISIGYFLLGIYLSLLFIDNWKLNINKTLLLCVSFPCLIFGLYTPIAYMTNASLLQLIPGSATGISSLIGGYSLMKALFDNSIKG